MVHRRLLALSLVASLTWVPSLIAQASTDPDVARGIRQVEDGDYDPAIVTLDEAARRLAGDPGRSRDLSQAYLYLGIAYIGKGHEAAAKAKFREAVAQIKDLTLSPDKFPPKVIDLFEAARAEARAEAAPSATPAPAPAPASAGAPKKGGGSKALLIVGGLAVVGGGVALAAGGGGGAASTTPTTTLPVETRNSQTFAGTLADQEGRGFTFVPTKAGIVDATLTWQDRQIQLGLECQLSNPPYDSVGHANRTADTTMKLTAPVTQNTYFIWITN